MAKFLIRQIIMTRFVIIQLLRSGKTIVYICLLSIQITKSIGLDYWKEIGEFVLSIEIPTIIEK